MISGSTSRVLIDNTQKFIFVTFKFTDFGAKYDYSYG